MFKHIYKPHDKWAYSFYYNLSLRAYTYPRPTPYPFQWHTIAIKASCQLNWRRSLIVFPKSSACLHDIHQMCASRWAYMCWERTCVTKVPYAMVSYHQRCVSCLYMVGKKHWMHSMIHTNVGTNMNDSFWQTWCTKLQCIHYNLTQ